MFLSTVIILAVCLASRSQRSFVETAPVNEGNPGDTTTSPQDSNVRELESLKHSLDKTLSMMKTHSSVYTNINGQKATHTDTQTQLNENGQLLAKIGQHIDAESKESDRKSTASVRTNLDIPSKGIHKSVIQQLPIEYQTMTENGHRRSPEMNPLTEPDNNLDKFNSLTGVQYSPLDMAEYVFWTGDEKGVTLAIEEFLQEGLMTREEAISFLQEIKYNLDYLKNHYTLLGLNSREHKNQETSSKFPNYEKTTSPSDKPELKSSININQLRQEINKKKDPEMSHTVQIQHKPNEMEKTADEDYDELLERLRVADFLYTEYSLEEVIYQLAKVMFEQSLTRGNAEAQQALQKFTNFLEVEAEQGHISRSLEKKVLDVLIAALSDTFGEHPELLANARETLTTSTNRNDQHLLRQILEINPDEKPIDRTGSLTTYKEQNGHNLQHDQIKINNRIPLNIGKYKNP